MTAASPTRSDARDTGLAVQLIDMHRIVCVTSMLVALPFLTSILPPMIFFFIVIIWIIAILIPLLHRDHTIYTTCISPFSST